MSALFDDETTSQYKDIGKRVLNQLKTFTFLIYYQLSHLRGEFKTMNLEKLSFKLKEDKNPYLQKYGEYSKNVQLSFYDIENENEVSNSLHDLKVSAQQSKTKLIFFSSESRMVNFYLKAKCANIHIENIPLCLYTSGIHGDFSQFVGWGEPTINNLSCLSVSQIEGDVRKWVESPAEKMDIWSVEIKVSEEGGSIEKLNENNKNFEKFKLNEHRQLFLSNLSIGYHPQLLLEYEQKKTTQQSSFFNKIMYSFEGFKKFCCVGNSDMRESTGIVKVDFVDEKGGHQILKYLRDLQRDQQSEYLHKDKSINRKKVLSIVLSNIDRFFGEKIENNQDSKMNDQKLELITFKSIKEATKIASVSGQINMQFTPDHAVYIQINDSCYRLEKPLALKVESFGKAKIIINKETLSC